MTNLNDLSSKVVSPAEPTGSIRFLPADEEAVSLEIGAGKVVFLQVFTAARSEMFAVFESAGETKYLRGTDGTSAQSWPIDACICHVRTVDGPICEESDDSDESACAPTNFLAGKGIRLETDDAGNVTISLAPTGVAARDYGGLEVDACGRITRIDDDFPHAIEYDACPCG